MRHIGSKSRGSPSAEDKRDASVGLGMSSIDSPTHTQKDCVESNLSTLKWIWRFWMYKQQEQQSKRQEVLQPGPVAKLDCGYLDRSLCIYVSRLQYVVGPRCAEIEAFPGWGRIEGRNMDVAVASVENGGVDGMSQIQIKLPCYPKTGENVSSATDQLEIQAVINDLLSELMK
eukprot:1162065-Pelagomonas_calceolata.AAC.12